MVRVEPDVFVQDASYDVTLDHVREVFQRFPLEVRGKNVLVKPNLLGLFKPEQAVTTHPSLVRCVVQYLQEQGAKVTVGDNPGLRGYGDNERIAKHTEVYDACEGTFQNIAGDPVRVQLGQAAPPLAGGKGESLPPFDKGGSRGDCSVLISKAVLDADLIISLPKLKTHVLTQITCAIKNTYGYLIGAEKTRLHARGLCPPLQVQMYGNKQPQILGCLLRSASTSLRMTRYRTPCISTKAM